MAPFDEKPPRQISGARAPPGDPDVAMKTKTKGKREGGGV
jgi:hypothetical protein